MASKMDRWKAISAGSKGEKESPPNKDKPELIAQLSRVPVEGATTGSEETTDNDGSNSAPIIIEETSSEKSNKSKKSDKKENRSIDSTPESVVQNKSTESEYEVGVESTNNTATDNDDNEEEQEQKLEQPVQQEVAATTQGNSFVSRVNENIRYTIDNKVTKEKTHRKTSVLLRNETADKLVNFDMAMGGRIQGLFINDLLDNFFEELEQDEKWRKILSKKVIRRR